MAIDRWTKSPNIVPAEDLNAPLDKEEKPVPDKIAEHWGQDIDIDAVMAALAKLNIDQPDIPLREHLVRASKLDHFHGGGIHTTDTLMSLMPLPFGDEVRGLDIGCGMGGPARWFALQRKANIDGIDITPQMARIATEISRMVGMESETFFATGDALKIPGPDSQYDFAVMMAVSCNIPQRDELYQSIHRVLKPGGVVGMLDILKGPRSGLIYPVPWAQSESEGISRLLTAEETIAASRTAGLTLEAQQDVSQDVLAWFKNELEELDEGRPIGFETVFPRWLSAAQSQVANLEEDRIRFSCLVFTKPE
jgi:ubiquinone/menaquinone biosynthesis C-methylase UbiE